MEKKQKSSVKKLFLTLAIIGIVFILTGGTVFTVALANNDWNFSNLDTEELSATYFLDTENRTFDRIEFRGNWRYVIRMGNEFRVDYYLSSVREITTSQTKNSNGNYTFVFYEGREQWWQNISFGFNGIQRREKTIYITVTQSITAYFRGASSRVTADGVDFINFNMQGSSSRLDLRNSAVGNNITITGASTNVYLRDVEVGGHIIVDGSSVRLEVSNIKAGRLETSGASTRFFINYSIIDTIVSSGSSSLVELFRSEIRHINITGASVSVQARAAHLQSLRVDGSSFRGTLELYGVQENIRPPNITGSNRRVNITGYSGAGVGFIEFDISGASTRLDIRMLGGNNVFMP